MYLDLFANVTFIAFFIFLYGQIFKNSSLNNRQTFTKQIATGIFFGILGAVLMTYTIHVTDTIIADLRHIPIITAAILSGPFSALLVSVIVAIYRVAYYGISTASLVGVILALSVGIGCSFVARFHMERRNKFIAMVIYTLILATAAYGYLLDNTKDLLKLQEYYLPITLAGAAIAYFSTRYIVSSNMNFITMSYFGMMADNLTDMISTHRLDGTYLYASQSSLQLLGYDSEELVGRNALDMAYPDDIDAIRCFFNQMRDVTDSGTYAYRLNKKQGDSIWVETSVKLIRNKDHSVKEVVCVTRDISKRKSEQEKLQKINEELKKEKMNADRQKAAAIEANRYKSQFLANMSHELRTPLNSIIGFNARVMKKSSDILPSVQREYLSIVQEEAQHLLELINSLLDYSKIEAGKMDIHIEEFNLSQVIDEAYMMTASLQDGKNIKYEQELFKGGEIPIRSDRIKVKQILVNLLSNAYKYSEKGRIKLSVEQEGGAYLIKIEDEGIGISADNIENIFDEFHQVDGSYTRKVGGTGLGLSITKRFVEMLGGRISAESVLGEGSVFIIRIPVRLEPEPDRVG